MPGHAILTGSWQRTYYTVPILRLLHQEPAMLVQQHVLHVPAEHLLHCLLALQNHHTGLGATHWETCLPAQTTQTAPSEATSGTTDAPGPLGTHITSNIN